MLGKFIYSQAKYYLRYIGDTPYAVPSVFQGKGAREPGQQTELISRYCTLTGKGIHEWFCPDKKGAQDSSDTGLSSRSMIGSYHVGPNLNSAGITFSGDTITHIPDNDKIEMLEIDGMRGYHFLRGPAPQIFFVDAQNVIQIYADCSRLRPICTVRARTPHGILRFPSHGPSEPDLERWRKDQAWHLALFDEWRCEEATCDGKFEAAGSMN